MTNQNASVSGGNLIVGVNESSGLVESNEIFHHGRFEVKLKSPNPLDFLSSVKLIPGSDIYEGSNELQAFGSQTAQLMAGARYGFGLFNAVVMNDEVTETISDALKSIDKPVVPEPDVTSNTFRVSSSPIFVASTSSDPIILKFNSRISSV